jgi:hypothetical protein
VKRFVAWLLVLFAALLPVELVAQSADPPSISAAAQPRDVEVGEPFTISLTIGVDSSSPAPSDPRLALPDAIRAGSPSISNQFQVSFVNGHMSRTSSVTATWQAVAAREGFFMVTPSATWNGKKVQANPVRIKVHAATPGGRRRPPQPTPNPFDPFGMFPRLPFFDAPETEVPQVPPADPELALDAPLDQRVFLRSVVDQKNPVVGEQVTLTIYVYRRSLSVGSTDGHDPSIPEFFVRELSPNGSNGSKHELRTVAINGVTWYVEPILKKALFPLRAGDLDIGPMRATFAEAMGRGAPLARESQAIQLHVAEPPLAGRPIGYQIGDVGSYTLVATVEPRTSEIGGAVAVNVTLSGTGNLPNAVRVPASSTFEWLEPETREDIEVDNGKIKGSRTFSYVVRPKAPGTLDMGEVTLPFWNPERKAYEVARAALGKVQVTPGATSPLAKDPSVPHDAWSGLPTLRGELGAYARPRDPLTERPFYWLGLVVGPFAIVAGSIGTRGLRRIRAGIAKRHASHENGIDAALAQARDAKRRNDSAALAAALERAVYLSIERATALKARALLIDQIPTALEERSVPRELAEELCKLLSSIEATRFTPDDAPRAGDLAERVAGVVRRMGRLPAAAKGVT